MVLTPGDEGARTQPLPLQESRTGDPNGTSALMRVLGQKWTRLVLGHAEPQSARQAFQIERFVWTSPKEGSYSPRQPSGEKRCHCVRPSQPHRESARSTGAVGRALPSQADCCGYPCRQCSPMRVRKQGIAAEAPRNVRGMMSAKARLGRPRRQKGNGADALGDHPRRILNRASPRKARARKITKRSRSFKS